MKPVQVFLISATVVGLSGALVWGFGTKVESSAQLVSATYTSRVSYQYKAENTYITPQGGVQSSSTWRTLETLETTGTCSSFLECDRFQYPETPSNWKVGYAYRPLHGLTQHRVSSSSEIIFKVKDLEFDRKERRLIVSERDYRSLLPAYIGNNVKTRVNRFGFYSLERDQ